MMAIVTCLRSHDKGTFTFIFWLTFTLNLYIAVVVFTSVPSTRTPLCYDRQRCNVTELDDTLSETKSEIHKIDRSSPKFWALIALLAGMLNFVWIYCNTALSLELYQLNISRRCVLNVMIFTHLLFMLSICVISSAHQRDSPTFGFSLLCQSVFFVIFIIFHVFYVECLSEFYSRNQKEVEQVKYCNFKSKCQNVTV